MSEMPTIDHHCHKNVLAAYNVCMCGWGEGYVDVNMIHVTLTHGLTIGNIPFHLPFQSIEDQSNSSSSSSIIRFDCAADCKYCCSVVESCMNCLSVAIGEPEKPGI